MAPVPDSLLLLMASPFVGSFLAMLVHRLPAGKPVFLARSACAQCGHPLGWRDLIPVASWLAAGGRCRYCDAEIGVLYPGMELGALAVAAWAALVLPDGLVWSACVLGWTLLVLGTIDVRHFILPDCLTVPLTVAGIAVAWIIVPERLTDHLIGAGAGFVLFVLIGIAYRLIRGRVGLGLGDAKLAAAAGAWVSWQGLAGTVLIGAGLALAGAVAVAATGRELRAETKIPFGAFLALGTWITWLYGPLGSG